MILWSLIEELSAVLCMNLPPCRHLIGRALPGRQLLTTNNTTNNTTKPSQWKSQLATGGTAHTRPTADMHDSKPPLVFAGGGGGCGFVTTISAGHSHNRPKSKGGSMVSTVSEMSTVSTIITTTSGGSRPSWPGLVTSELLVEVHEIAQRPLSAPASVPQQLDVEIDRSELGMTEVLRGKNWMAARDGRYAR